MDQTIHSGKMAEIQKTFALNYGRWDSVTLKVGLVSHNFSSQLVELSTLISCTLFKTAKNNPYQRHTVDKGVVHPSSVI